MKIRTSISEIGVFQEYSSQDSSLKVDVPLVDAAGTFVENPVLSISQMYSSFLVGHFGDGQDGDVIISDSTTTGGPLNTGYLTRDAYFNNLTMAPGGAIKTNGFRIFVKETLDLSQATSQCFYVPDPPAGGNGAPTATGGVGISNDISVTFGTTSNYLTALITGAGTTGGTGGTGAGNQGNNTLGASYVTYPGGIGGAGGAGTGGAGGPLRNPASNLTPYRWTILGYGFSRTTGSTLRSSQAGGAGGGGGGDGTAGGGGGAGGVAGSAIHLSAKKILTSSSTASGLFYSVGGAGGNGGTPAAGNRGGGGGGGGGCGGLILVTYLQRQGPAVSNAFVVNGGIGGDKGSKSGSGTDGIDGIGGAGGAVVICNATTGICTTLLNTTPASGKIGGFTTASL